MVYVLFTYTKYLIVFIEVVFENFWKIKDLFIWKKTIILIANLYVVLLMKALWSLVDLYGEFVIMRQSSLSLAMKYIENRVINYIIFVLVKCININIYLHNVQRNVWRQLWNVQLNLSKFACINQVIRLIFEDRGDVRITCYIIVDFNVYYM